MSLPDDEAPARPAAEAHPFLADPALRPLWQAVAAALDRNGLDWRGRLTLPVLPAEGRRRLGVLVERPVPVGRRALPLADVAAAVERLTGGGLVEALVALDCAPRGRREAAQARRAESQHRRVTLDRAVETYLAGLAQPDSPDADGVGRDAGWSAGWRDAAWSDGLFAGRTPEEVAGLVRTVAAVLAHTGSGLSRGEIAARECGDAHALDGSTRLAALITRALVARDGPAGERAAWERAGMPLDLVSAPVLTWALPLLGDSAVARAARAMTAAGLPLHLTVLALRAAPLTIAAGTPVLVVENPRLVEAAARRRLPAAVLCTGGNPATAPTEAIAKLSASGAALRYHGDFDAAGLAMTARAGAAGCVPFRMSAADYRTAVEAARAEGVELPRDPAPAPPTPWDPDLAAAFTAERAIVHEERLMDTVLTAHEDAPSPP
ncbi:DUF2399 domain-containing protein [Frankia sp. QA3]|uniref:DUF2399 domain-containing protein n=1 Tax=Frankia sp. QA3 TaxID=710111 RepID=UPI000269CA44|nr:DUF2399 domain-containing protein [Frankia sp. QA3]EIV94703.1 Protein of unknown function (DUF2399)/Protein of unknown function (DUF3323) [Frankia sp. QA3]